MENNKVGETSRTTKKEHKKKVTNSAKRPGDMNSRKKLFKVLIAIIFILAIVLVIVPFIKKGIDKSSAAGKIAEEKSFESYKLVETKISYEEDTTIFETKIENIGTETVPEGGFNIVLLDKEGIELTSIGVYLKEMEPAEIIETKAVISEKIENIYDMKIVGIETGITDSETVSDEVPEQEFSEDADVQ